MAKYLVTHEWYENTTQGIIIADTKEMAIYEFIKMVTKLNSDYVLEHKYGFASDISLFCQDVDETFESAYHRYIDAYEDDYIKAIELTDETLGIITDKGFYNGQDE